MSSVLIVVTHGPDTPEMCGAPFLYAQDAAAQGCATEMFFTTNGTRLMKKRIGTSVFPKAGGKSIQQFIAETVEKGVRLLVCQPSLQLNSMTEEDLIDEVDTLVGTAYLITQGLKSDLVLSF
jgi:uncharacterized protein